jgi:hypothetical protein
MFDFHLSKWQLPPQKQGCRPSALLHQENSHKPGRRNWCLLSTIEGLLLVYCNAPIF